MEGLGLKSVAEGTLWIVEILIGFSVLGFVNWGFKRLIKFMSKRYGKRSDDWRSRLNFILYAPLTVLTWLLGFAYAIDILGNRFNFSADLKYLAPFRSGAIVSCGAWILLRWKQELHKNWIAKSQLGKKAIDPGAAHILGRLSSIGIGIIATLIVLQILGLDIVPLLAFSGVGAAAIGFAGKDALANFFGGLMLHLTRPFLSGDYIRIEEKNIEGIAEEIGWYLTGIRDLDKRPAYVPNALFSSVLVTNFSRMSHRKFEESFSLSFDAAFQIQEVVEELKVKITSHLEVDGELPILISFSGIEEHALKLSVCFYCLETRLVEFTRLKQEFLVMIHHSLRKRGIRFASLFLTLSDAVKQSAERCISDKKSLLSAEGRNQGASLNELTEFNKGKNPKENKESVELPAKGVSQGQAEEDKKL